MLLQKNYNNSETSIDEWPFWMFEENISIANEINEESESNEEEATNDMPKMDTSSIMRNMQNMQNNIPKF